MPESWSPPLRPAAHAEQSLITAILDGRFAPGRTLPAERELARLLGVTRPTLREALQRMERDGWLVIQQGKPTRVNDIWISGGLNALSALVHSEQHLPAEFIPNLLAVRLALAPAYTLAALQNNPLTVITYLQQATHLPDSPEAYARFDWQLHHTLTLASGNPIYTLILNGFAGFYEIMAIKYYNRTEARQASFAFYSALLDAFQSGNANQAVELTRQVMQTSLELWHAG